MIPLKELLIGVLVMILTTAVPQQSNWARHGSHYEPEKVLFNEFKVQDDDIVKKKGNFIELFVTHKRGA